MTITEIKQKIDSKEYDFLRTNEHLGNNIILLGLGGSHAYGTNTESSDLDVRGIALNSKKELLTNANFEQFVNEETDTTIYSFNKMITLLSNCNPNTIELLGLKPEHYVYLSDIGKELLDNKEMFLSKRAINSFGGYANQQLYRLKQRETHKMNQDDLEKHILVTLNNIKERFNEKYSSFQNDFINLYIDESDRENMIEEIFMDVNLTHYPLRDYCKMWNELQNTVTQYGTIGKRNKRALENNKISKHMMHLVRLYLMCFDILEKHEINTYRDKEHDFLMDIRNGKYVNENNEVSEEFYDIVNELEKRFIYDKTHTSLPENPDYKKINEFMMYVNEMVIKNET